MMVKTILTVAFLAAATAGAYAFVAPKAAFRLSARRGSTADFSSKLGSGAGHDAKVVLITGASQGLGQGMAYEMAKNGAKVVVNYIAGCEDDAKATVEKCIELGGDAIAVQVSMRS